MFSVVVGLAPCAGAAVSQTPADPLPSWNDGRARQAIVDFVRATTDKAGPRFVLPEERISVIDNDGTLWCEKPAYVQAFFVFDRVRELAPAHPEWKTIQPFKAILEKDMKYLGEMSEEEIMKVVIATHSGMTEERFEGMVRQFLETWSHPRFKVGYTQLVYQPMLELLAYLRANGFKTFICTGGGIEFVRQAAPVVYGIPPEQVIGSSIKYKYQEDGRGGAIMREPAIDLITDRGGKPVGIQLHIGRRPLLAAGNSDGDIQMLEFGSGRDGATLGLLVHHDDAEREYAYDKGTENALKEAGERGWIVISMKKDWKTIFPPQQK